MWVRRLPVCSGLNTVRQGQRGNLRRYQQAAAWERSVRSSGCRRPNRERYTRRVLDGLQGGCRIRVTIDAHLLALSVDGHVGRACHILKKTSRTIPG